MSITTLIFVTALMLSSCAAQVTTPTHVVLTSEPTITAEAETVQPMTCDERAYFVWIVLTVRRESQISFNQAMTDLGDTDEKEQLVQAAYELPYYFSPEAVRDNLEIKCTTNSF